MSLTLSFELYFCHVRPVAILGGAVVESEIFSRRIVDDKSVPHSSRNAVLENVETRHVCCKIKKYIYFGCKAYLSSILGFQYVVPERSYVSENHSDDFTVRHSIKLTWIYGMGVPSPDNLTGFWDRLDDAFHFDGVALQTELLDLRGNLRRSSHEHLHRSRFLVWKTDTLYKYIKERQSS